jgi:hypothetical protein
MPLHILLCDDVPLYFILRIGIIRNLNLKLNSNEFVNYKVFQKLERIFPIIYLIGPKPTLSPS